MRGLRVFFHLVLLTALVLPAHGEPSVKNVVRVAPVWSGHPVGFALFTDGEDQFVGFYDADRYLTLAHRQLYEETWQFARLDEKVGWDSHNYIHLIVDRDGYLHVWANMHVDPLVYFRSTQPRDIASMERIGSMEGTKEDRMTYPATFYGANGELIFTYRDGSSGSGNQIYNVYDRETKEWRRLLDQPLIDGEGERNAYLAGPTLGPDGRYHLAWVWRDTSDAATNHTLSYARSDDLLHWEKGDATPLQLPITFETAEVIDPVPPGGGMINGNVRLGFDQAQRVVVSYHKYDADGFTQVYNARRESNGWRIYQVTDWDSRWDFGGGGSIDFDVRVQAVSPFEGDRLVQGFSNKEEGSGRWVLDAATFQILDILSSERRIPTSLSEVQSEYPGMQPNFDFDSGDSTVPDLRYLLRWETLGRNRDKPRDEIPPPTMLELYAISME